MRNVIERNVSFLVTRTGDAISGMTKNAGQIALPNTVEADLPQKLADTIDADNSHKQAKVELSDARIALRQAERETFAYAALVRDVLKKVLGSKHSTAWHSTGLVSSLALPRTAEGMLPLLQSIKGHLTTNTAHAVEALNVTGTDVTAHYNALLSKRNAVLNGQGECNRLLTLRNTNAKALERGLRILLGELHKKLTPTDDRWVEFGFKKPGARSTPDVPENLTAILIGTNAISMKWSAAARATSYRVWKKVIGQDNEFVPLDSRTDLDHTIEGLPGNSTVEVAVSAINNGGESKLSMVVVVQTL